MDREVSGVFLIYFLRSGRVHTSNNYAVLGLRRHVVSNFWQWQLSFVCESAVIGMLAMRIQDVSASKKNTSFMQL
jgi:hypothetical protein